LALELHTLFLAFSVAVILGKLFQLRATAGLRRAAVGQGAAGNKAKQQTSAYIGYTTLQ